MEILFLIGFTLHNIEEAIWLPKWSKSAKQYHAEVTTKQFIFAASIITILGYLISFQYLFYFNNSIIGRYIYLGFISMMVLNVIFPHLALTIILKKYAPGLVSGLFFTLPTGIMVLKKNTEIGINLYFLVISTLLLAAIFIALIKLLFNLYQWRNR